MLENLPLYWFGEDDVNILLTDFSYFVDIADTDINILQRVEIDGDDRLDMLSYHLYKDTQYWWTFLILNKIENPYNELPMLDYELTEFVEKSVIDVEGISHHENKIGEFVDTIALALNDHLQGKNTNFSIDNLKDDYKNILNLSEKSFVDVFENENERKRKIKIIRPEHIGKFSTFVINKIKSKYL